MRALAHRLRPEASAAGAIALVALAWALTLALLEPRGVWVIDSAVKLLQTRAAAASGGRDLSLAWAGAALDPEQRFRPLPAPFGVVEDAKLQGFYPPAFALLSALPWQAFGMRGLLLVPFASGVLLLAGVARAARTLGADAPGRSAAVLVAGLCTPVWFYAVVFWEHVPAACLAVWGVEGVLRFLRDGAHRALVRGCALAALAAYLRDEFYLFAGVLAAVAVWRSPGRRAATAATAAAALALAVLPLWAYQAFALGHPLGLHATSQFAPDLAAHLRERAAVFHTLLLATVPDHTASLLLAGPLLAALALAPRVSARGAAWFAPALAAFAALGCGISLAGYWRTQSPIGWLRETNGLLAAAPVLALAGLRFRDASDAPVDARLAGALRASVIAYTAVHVLVAPIGGAAGVHWGNRFLLVLYPLLALLAGPNLARCLRRGAPQRALAALALGAAVALGFGAQLVSLRLLEAKLAFSVRLAEAIARHPGTPVASSVFWVGAELFDEWPRRPLFTVASSADLRTLEARLRSTGHRTYLLVTPEGSARKGALVEHIDDGGLGFFGLDVARVDL
jgi:hypothetical protein